jgi:hypothetical protein
MTHAPSPPNDSSVAQPKPPAIPATEQIEQTVMRLTAAVRRI